MHTIEMTANERCTALASARDLAVHFTAAGADHDRENSFPVEMVEHFRASGLSALNIPKRFGGGGADIELYTECVQILAEGDPATALAFNMHLGVIGFFRGMWSEANQERLFPGVAASGYLFDGAYSETRAEVIGIADTIAVPVEGGYLISGRKTWTTLSLAATHHTFNACITDRDGNLAEDIAARGASEVMFVCPADAKGLRIQLTWDAMGMRASGTETIVFEEVFVPE
jgi:alkylation response protein AidB-like acyl-CoA dehydrogenase